MKTIQIKRQGRRWMLVLSCDEVPTKPLPVTGRQAGIDVGIVSIATTSDGERIDNPRWARAASERLAAAQQRLQRARRGGRNRAAKRETVAARYRKIANQRKDFHHKQARELAARYDLIVVEDLTITNMLRRAKPVPDPVNPGRYLPNGARAKSGSTDRSVTLAGASSSRYCAPKRKRLGGLGLRSTPGTPPTGVSAAGTQRARTASRKRSSPANAAVTAHRQMNTPHATSCGPDWPITPTRREERLAASAVREVTESSHSCGGRSGANTI